jgi:hypothetical protein
METAKVLNLLLQSTVLEYAHLDFHNIRGLGTEIIRNIRGLGTEIRSI